MLVGPSTHYGSADDERIFSDWIPKPFAATPRDDAAYIATLLPRRDRAFAVLDDYRIDEAYQVALREADARWLQFNGQPRQPLWADIVLNPSPAVREEDYRESLRRTDTRLLLGPGFAVLRPEFALAERAPRDGAPARILLTFGGGDDRGLVLRLLEALLPALPPEIAFLVVSGRHNPRNGAIAGWVGSRGGGRVELQIAPDSMANAIASCDLAIMAGGGTVYEVNSFGIPMLLIAIAENQIAHSRAWDRPGAAKYLGTAEELDIDVLVAETKAALSARSNGGRRADRLVDGLGRVRVAEQILDAMNP